MIAILLLDIQTKKIPIFFNSHHLNANFPNYKGPGPQIQMSTFVGKSLVTLGKL
jgi:hypothetical protein